MSGIVVVKSAFQSAIADTGDATKYGPNAHNAALLFSGGSDGDLLLRDALSATGSTYLSDIAVGNVLLSGGVGVAPSYGKVNLASMITGTLPAGNVDLTGVVPTTRTVNGHALSGDISVTLADLGAVPTSRTINGFALTGNITLALSDLGGSITVAQGGTGISSYAIGDLIFASASTTLSKLADVAAGSVLLSGGVGAAPSYGKVDLTSHVTGNRLTFGTFGSINAVSDGVWTLLNNAGTGFGRLQIGGTTGSFAALRNTGAQLDAITGDAGAYTNFKALGVLASSYSTNSALLISNVAPTIASGFGTSPTVPSQNGTLAFTVNVGTGGVATSGVITLPAATTGWIAFVTNITAAAAHRADNTRQTASTTTSVTLENQTTSTGAALAWTASDILRVSCFAY